MAKKHVEINRIKEVLSEQEMTQAELANKLGLTYVAVTNYVNNKRQPPIGVFLKIAGILKVDVRELLNSTK